MKASVIGLGQMGAAIAAALVSAGHDVTVWNRTPGKAVENTIVAPTAADAITASPVALAVVSDYATVRELFADATGGALINLATGTPEEAQEMAEWAAARGSTIWTARCSRCRNPSPHPTRSSSTAGQRRLRRAPRNPRCGGDQPLPRAGPDRGRGVGQRAARHRVFALLGYLHAAALLDTAGTSPSQFQPMVGQWLTTMAG